MPDKETGGHRQRKPRRGSAGGQDSGEPSAALARRYRCCGKEEDSGLKLRLFWAQVGRTGLEGRLGPESGPHPHLGPKPGLEGQLERDHHCEDGSPGKGTDITWTACSEREARDLTLSSDAKSQHISG
ncbi:hypothetical protein MG293_002321 [Ovis ammon polii]|uniref:Uncharacterized protein n=1 Tax=Ovis ammon polii TaxID=230172 RepID=A0AAD4UGU1_OVIAM|nr:hypothetical protein MG293_002321 [Ovis ammon polii]